MDLFLRFTLIATLLVGTVFGLGFSQPEWATSLGLDFWRLPELERRLEQEKVREAKLAEAQVDIERRSRLKEQAINQVIRGKISLADATARVIEASDDHFFTFGIQSLGVSGSTLEEQVARCVILWSDMALHGQPARARAVRCRLESELATMLHHG